MVLHNLDYSFLEGQESGLDTVSQMWLHMMKIMIFRGMKKMFYGLYWKFFSSDVRFQSVFTEMFPMFTVALYS